MRPPGEIRFPTTHWSIVLEAGGPNSGEAKDALSALIEAYWYPLYAFSRRSGNSHHDAMDLTQGFFAHLLRRQGLDFVSPHKGRFRSYMLASFKNYMANEHRAAQAQRRGGSVTTCSLATADFQTRYDHQPSHEETPERLYELRWVESLMQRVRDRLAGDYQRAKKVELFELLVPHLTDPAKALPRKDICRQLNLSTAALAMSIHRMRRRYGELLREEVSATVEDAADIDDEVRMLMAILSGKT